MNATCRFGLARLCLSAAVLLSSALGCTFPEREPDYRDAALADARRTLSGGRRRGSGHFVKVFVLPLTDAKRAAGLPFAGEASLEGYLVRTATAEELEKIAEAGEAGGGQGLGERSLRKTRRVRSLLVGPGRTGLVRLGVLSGGGEGEKPEGGIRFSVSREGSRFVYEIELCTVSEFQGRPVETPIAGGSCMATAERDRFVVIFPGGKRGANIGGTRATEGAPAPGELLRVDGGEFIVAIRAEKL